MRMLQTLLLATMATVLAAQQPGKPAKQDPKPDAKPAKTDPSGKGPKALSLGNRANGEIVLKDIDGKEHKAKSYMGKITVVNFFSIQCPIQQAIDERLAEIQNEFTKKDVVFLNIDSNVSEIGETPPAAKDGKKPYDNIRSHLEANDLPYTVLVDHGNVVADAFGAKTTPDVFVFGKDGKLVYRGLIDDDARGQKGDDAKRHLRDVLTKLCAGEKVEAFETPPQGCTIKRVAKAKPTNASESKDGAKEHAKQKADGN
jgi:thiol-disulfide isomerase/thioredoxin